MRSIGKTFVLAAFFGGAIELPAARAQDIQQFLGIGAPLVMQMLQSPNGGEREVPPPPGYERGQPKKQKSAEPFKKKSAKKSTKKSKQAAAATSNTIKKKKKSSGSNAAPPSAGYGSFHSGYGGFFRPGPQGSADCAGRFISSC